MPPTDTVPKWAKGEHYGPVLSQTDLYLLNIPLELHPILQNTDPSFHLSFNLTNGEAAGFDPSNRDRSLPFTPRDQPATLPRVTQLIIITTWSPWCTIVTNDNGVTLGDVCVKLWTEYSQNTVTDAEFNSLPPRLQESVRRYAAANIATAAQSNQPWGGYYPPQAPPSQFKRYDWLRDRILFECLTKEGMDGYIRNRLGFTAPNIFVMELSA
ncbi:hypothetical protein CC1G_09175 [Coprinopsis cinerea okayama7|uniref:DUF6699 domain-containing protein n=1 Tax=Coprinopsis cinerea (strain Okayama-7 / 130 / ATCC MYA-4618 / FGSC 9003) TaxID=240176 RepID=A8P9U4_COPC7|nr:hypothetical protein CC1G_09175 [Coprinopsis cinerea okayama7\|eukprot:XP_001839841.1 hypothetical protein CC1G_09175 [Coprinopsis cinerea okayama7\